MKSVVKICFGLSLALMVAQGAVAKDLIWREVFASRIEKSLVAIKNEKGHLVVAGVTEAGTVQHNVNRSTELHVPNWADWKSLRLDEASKIIVSKNNSGGVQLSGVAEDRLFWSYLKSNGRFSKARIGLASGGLIDLIETEYLSARGSLLGLNVQGKLLLAEQKKGKYRTWNTIATELKIPGSIATATHPDNKSQLFAAVESDGVAVSLWTPKQGLKKALTIRGKNMRKVKVSVSASGKWEIFAVDTTGFLWQSRLDASGAWSDWLSPATLKVNDVIVTKTSSGQRMLFLLTPSNGLFFVQEKSEGRWLKHQAVPLDKNVTELAVVAGEKALFDLVMLDDDSRLWRAQFDSASDSDSVATYAQGPRYPKCTEYLPYEQYTDTWTNRLHMMIATPGSKTQMYYYTGGLIEESFAYSMFLDVTGGLSLAGCRPSNSILGRLESMGEAKNTYDQYGRIASQEGNYEGSSYSMLFNYNNYGFIESLTRNGVTCIEATYDVMQRVNSVTVHGEGACSQLFSNKQKISFSYLSTLSSVPNFAHGTSYKDEVPIIIASADIDYPRSNFNVDIAVKYTVAGGDDTVNLFSFETGTEEVNNALQVSEVIGRWDGAPVKHNQFYYDSNKYGFQDVVANGVNLEVTTLDEKVNYIVFGLGPIGLAYALSYE